MLPTCTGAVWVKSDSLHLVSLCSLQPYEFFSIDPGITSEWRGIGRFCPRAPDAAIATASPIC
jgi:hypothetical protein